MITPVKTGGKARLAAGVFLICLVLNGLVNTACAAETLRQHPLLKDDVVFRLGAFHPNATTAAALGPSTGGTGVVVDFEKTLGLEKRSLVPTANLIVRTSEDWRMEVDYFSLNRSASRTLVATIEWGDQTYTTGTTVNSKFDFSDLRVSAAYAFFRRPDKELAVGLGLHVADIYASIESSRSDADSGDVIAPLPVVNTYGIFALTDKWAVSMNADWLSLTHGDYSGDVRNLAIDFIYQPYRNVGFGFGIKSLTLDIEIDDPDWAGRVRTNFQGPTVYTILSF